MSKVPKNYYIALNSIFEHICEFSQNPYLRRCTFFVMALCTGLKWVVPPGGETGVKGVYCSLWEFLVDVPGKPQKVEIFHITSSIFVWLGKNLCVKKFFKKFSHKNIEKLLSKAAHNRHNFFFSTANWLKSSSNLNFCSIKNAHVTTYLCIMTLGWVNYKSLYQLGLFSLENHMFQLQVIIYSIEYIRGI